MDPRRLLLTTLLVAAALAVTAALAIQTAATGTPNPILLACAVMVASASVAYPLATAEFQGACHACGHPSLGLDLGFCARCGVLPQERSS